MTPVQSMDAEQAREFIAQHKEGSYVLLDVRQPREYEKARIPGAKLIPLPELPNRILEIPREEPIVVY